MTEMKTLSDFHKMKPKLRCF